MEKVVRALEIYIRYLNAYRKWAYKDLNSVVVSLFAIIAMIPLMLVSNYIPERAEANLRYVLFTLTIVFCPFIFVTWRGLRGFGPKWH